MGLLQTILGSLAGSQPDAAPEEHPADTLLKEILSGGAPSEDPSASPAPSPSSSGSDTAALNEVMGMPPDVAAKVTGNPGMYPNLAAILGGKQTKVPPRKPLDYLIAAASPLANAFASMMMTHRRSDRKGAFFSGLASGGINTLANEASRPERMRQAQREKDIQDILLQQKLRGTPTSGVDPATGKPKFQFQTGETVQGIVPEPKAKTHAQVHEVTMPDGSKQVMERDETSGLWHQAQAVSTGPAAKGTQRKFINPMVSAKQPENPKVEFRYGTTEPGSKKGSEDDQLYKIEEGKKPVPLGIWRPLSEKPTREGDIARQKKREVNDAALTFLDAAHNSLGAKAKPEEYVNLAKELFQKAAKTKQGLREYASEINSDMVTIGRNIKSGDELAQLVAALLGDQTKK